jgi:hypothetical protein
MKETPAAHRIMTKESEIIDGEKNLKTKSDNHFVIVRPKAFVDSSGSTWASDIVRLTIDNPDVFEIPRDEGSAATTQHRQMTTLIRNACFQYIDMTMNDDIKKISTDSQCPHRSYELNRVIRLLRHLDRAYCNYSMDSRETEEVLRQKCAIKRKI